MATGVFRGEGASQAEAERRRRQQEEQRLRQQLAGVDWTGLGRLTGTGPATAGPPAPVRGGRGTAVNTVGQSAAVGRPGASMTATRPANAPTYVGGMPQLRPGQGGINEIGSGGFAIGGFPRGQIGSTAEQIYRDRTTPAGSLDLSGVDWEGLGQIMRDAGIPVVGGGGGTGGGTGGGGGGGGGSTPAPGTPSTTTNTYDELMKKFEELRAIEEGRIKSSGADLIAALQATDPMAQFQWNPASVTIPQATMADYVSAIGGSPGEIQATQQLGQQLLGAFLGDVGQVAEGAKTAQANWRQRQQDVANQLTADAQRQLALNALAAQMGIQSAKTADEQAKLNQALQLALEYGRTRGSGGNLSVTAPNLPFQSVTLPGYGTITLPSTLG